MIYSRLLIAMALLMCAACASTPPYDVVVQGGRVMDPATNTDAILNVGVRNGRIAALSSTPLKGSRTIDARGLVVAPGFIDLHAHGQNDESFRVMVRDGVTTALELELGTDDVAAWYARREGGQILNYGVSVGHTPVRMRVLGDSGTYIPLDRGGTDAATPAQISDMKRQIEKGLREGAVAIGIALGFTPGATRGEFEEVMQVVAQNGTTAHIHIRDGEAGLDESIAVAAVTGAALHVVHANSSGAQKTPEFLEKIAAARDRGQDVTTEAYPYEAGMTRIDSARFDDWPTWSDETFAMHVWPATGERLTRETYERYRKIGGEVLRFTRTEEMTRIAIANPLTMIASDGEILEGHGHPRTAGTYSKVLGFYVREKHGLTLMDALSKMTFQPARRLEHYVPAMRMKGRLAVGADADITIFDPNTIIDRATYKDPTLPSQGVMYVVVNGISVVDEGELVPDARPGRAVRRR